MDHVKAHVPGPRPAHDGVQVGPVVVELHPRLLAEPGDLQDAPFKEAQGVGVREHEGGHVGAELALQGLEVHLPSGPEGISRTW